MRALYRRLPRGLREVVWETVDRLPDTAQRLFPHTDSHRRWKMQQLYRRTPAPRPDAPTVLFWVPGGMELLLHVETAVAAALQLRGYKVHAVICDATSTACTRREAQDGVPFENWKAQCARCIATNRNVLETMGIPYSFIGDFIPQEKRESLWTKAQTATAENVGELSHNGVTVGQNVISSLIRYRRGYPIEIEPRVLQQYAYSALITAEAARVAIGRFKPKRVFMSHGVYVDWGPALHTAISNLVPVTTWKSSYLPARFFLQQVDHGSLDFYRLSDAAWKKRASTPLSDEEEQTLQRVMDDRYHEEGAFDVQKLHREMGEVDRFCAEYDIDRIDRGKPVWGVMCHINWDSVSDYAPMAYASFDDWLVETVQHVSGITDVQWLIKIHPAEATYDREVGVEALLQKRFPNLPSHVKVIPPTERISPLEFFKVIDGGVTVYGTAGLELAVTGKPVILAGEAHYGRKGFTEDGLDRATYRQLLSRAASIGPLDPEQVALARRYGYSLFIERQIPLPVVRDQTRLWWNLQHDKRENLLPGADPFLDFICDRVIDGESFIMDRKLVQAAAANAW